MTTKINTAHLLMAFAKFSDDIPREHHERLVNLTRNALFEGPIVPVELSLGHFDTEALRALLNVAVEADPDTISEAEGRMLSELLDQSGIMDDVDRIPEPAKTQERDT